MPRASKRSLNKEIKEELNLQFSKLISGLKKPRDIEQFFSDFLTREEQLMLTKRLMLRILITNGHSWRDIASSLGITYETVRVHKSVHLQSGEVYKKVVVYLAKRRNVRQMIKRIGHRLEPLEALLNFKTNMKSRARLFDGGLSPRKK